MNMLNEYIEIIVGGAYCAGYMHGRRAAELAFESYAYHAITVSPVVSAYLWTLTLHSNRYSDAIKEASLILQSNQEEVKEQEACKATPNTLPVFEAWDLDEAFRACRYWTRDTSYRTTDKKAELQKLRRIIDMLWAQNHFLRFNLDNENDPAEREKALVRHLEWQEKVLETAVHSLPQNPT